MKKQLLVIGGGFAGYWSAMSAVRQSREIQKEGEIEVTLVNPDNYMTIRPRLYEVSLEGLRVELDKYLKPVGIKQIIGKADVISPEKNEVIVSTPQGLRKLTYDYLILAAGSALKAFNLPGIEYTYNVDTFNNAQRLEDHILELAKTGFSDEGAATFVVVGAGFTGMEAVTSIEDKAKIIQARLSDKKIDFKVVLIERGPTLAGFYASDGQQYIKLAMAAQNIEVVTDSEITSIDEYEVQLSSGVSIPSKTVIWTVGMLASPLTQSFKSERDSLNRLMVDTYLKLPNYDNVIIAGDVANVSVDNGHPSVMACQYTQFEGRWAGHNAVNDMFSKPLKEYIQNGYVTCLDLGTDHAIYTTGWERTTLITGTEAKNLKAMINTQALYPPADPEEAIKASYPEIPQW